MVLVWVENGVFSFKKNFYGSKAISWIDILPMHTIIKGERWHFNNRICSFFFVSSSLANFPHWKFVALGHWYMYKKKWTRRPYFHFSSIWLKKWTIWRRKRLIITIKPQHCFQKFISRQTYMYLFVCPCFGRVSKSVSLMHKLNGKWILWWYM